MWNPDSGASREGPFPPCGLVIALFGIGKPPGIFIDWLSYDIEVFRYRIGVVPRQRLNMAMKALALS